MKAVVSFSGGVDSTTCLAKAIKEYGVENVVGVSIQYGQKHIRELECADNIAKYYGIKRYTLDLSNIFNVNTTCSLLSNNKELEIDKRSYDEQYETKDTVTVATSVPYRNGLFVTALVSFGQSLFPNEKIKVYLGNHKDGDAGHAIYPDCSKDFSDKLNEAVKEGTANMVELVAPYADCIKAEIVKDGLSMGVPYHMTWSCYEGNDTPCGNCGTCRDAIEAFATNGIDYLAMYKGE